MTTYYVDAKNGCNANDGISIETSVKDETGLKGLVSGDRVMIMSHDGYGLTLTETEINDSFYTKVNV